MGVTIRSAFTRSPAAAIAKASRPSISCRTTGDTLEIAIETDRRIQNRPKLLLALGPQPRHRLAFNRFRLGACKQSLRGHLISNVDRSQQRLIVRKDECASRVAITRGLVVQS